MLQQIQLNSGMHQWLRRHKDELLSPLAQLCIRWRISPLLVTSIGAAIGLGSIPLLWVNYGWFALAQLVSLLCDGLDGTLARVSKRSSLFGAQLDYAVDLTIMLLTYSALTIWLQQPSWVIGLNWYIGLWLVNRLFGNMVKLAPMRLTMAIAVIFLLPQAGLVLTWTYAVVMTGVMLNKLFRKQKPHV